MKNLIVLAGVGQLLLALASLAIPAVLGWRADTAKLPALTRQVFWTYAAYIWAINLSFGLVSAWVPQWLLDGSALGRALCAFIALYWITRLLIQFFWFDRSAMRTDLLLRLGEAGLVSLFVYLSLVYAVAAVLGAS